MAGALTLFGAACWLLQRLHDAQVLIPSRDDILSPACPLTVFAHAPNVVAQHARPQPRLVVVFSGKRKSGKDYITDLLKAQYALPLSLM